VAKAFKKVTANNGASITVCLKCEKEYLKTAWVLGDRKYKRMGVMCPNPACDYIIKYFV